MEEKKEFKVTPGRLVLLREMNGGAVKKWSELRLAYFGPDRSKSKASTSFHTQLTKLIALNVVTKSGDGYTLTSEGQAILDKAKETIDVAACQSAAQTHYIAPVIEAPAAEVVA